ncbi:N-acetylglucosamine-specific PTS transporter subunit IIBC [Novosphingobium terrae]|uniref:N-acetylglucosamine-specific PTS transporter subunit IIBC n=1 Tax=Novosphingobium terrae TaxID=2726189 RepID=UPI00197F8388|nr:N-acetylglucosamine-specific PTS transporter subunit IIBC [Novosphingobium terrae]
MKLSLDVFQPLGRTLMLPIAVLPIAGLILRLGQPDLLNIPFFAASGNAIFANLGLLFAVGVAIGFAKNNNGTAGLGGAICYLVLTNGAQALLVLPPEIRAVTDPHIAELAAAAYRMQAIGKLSVPFGIISGLLCGSFYNRFSTVSLPEYLGFFAGNRLIPIMSAGAGLVLAGILGTGYGWINGGMDALSRVILHSGNIGLFAYGFLNKILIITGLHHVINNLAWFVVGDYHGVTGDLRRFFAGDPSAGGFMAGYFPVFMFGLPAACLAMYHAALPERRKEVSGMLASVGLTAFLTGITEPVEFLFMFLAPRLYLLHALLTGAAMVVMNMLDVKLGFGFSAGVFDYALNFDKATNPLMLLPVGAAYALVYYGVFSLFIRRYDLKTPGREPLPAQDGAPQATAGNRAQDFIAALGGPANLISIDACLTRLRLDVVDQAIVDEAALRKLGAKGLVRPSAHALQVVIGQVADQVAREMRSTQPLAAQPGGPTAPAGRETQPVATAAIDPRFASLANVLGGVANILDIRQVADRIRLELVDVGALDRKRLEGMGSRGVSLVRENTVHILLGDQSEGAINAIRSGLRISEKV